MAGQSATKKRKVLTELHFEGKDPYEPPAKGWFKAPRTLPMITSLLRSKKVSGKVDPGPVYLDLLSRHFDGGLVEIPSESDCAIASGYESSRGIRTWRERIKKLAELGFISISDGGVPPIRYVLLLPVDQAIGKLRDKGKVPKKWTDAYLARRLDTGEVTHADAKGEIDASSLSAKKKKQ